MSSRTLACLVLLSGAAGAATGQAITNASPVVFDITGSGTVKGLFLVGGIANAQNKGNHEAGGNLWATALFGTGDVPVNAIAHRFGGGGHENAAGCTLSGTLAEAAAALLHAVRESLGAARP